MQVLLADDHAMFREALLPFINRIQSDVTTLEAETLQQAVELAKSADELGLFILDLMMPGMNDVVGLRHVRSQYPDIPIVILSGSSDKHTIMRTIKNGASGFIPKSYGGEALINALRLVLSGVCYVPASTIMDFHSGNSTTAQISSASSSKMELTPEESETLAVLKNGCSNKEIARILGIQEVTVKKRLGRVCKKLGVSNRIQAVRVALERDMAS